MTRGCDAHGLCWKLVMAFLLDMRDANLTDLALASRVTWPISAASCARWRL